MTNTSHSELICDDVTSELADDRIVSELKRYVLIPDGELNNAPALLLIEMLCRWIKSPNVALLQDERVCSMSEAIFLAAENLQYGGRDQLSAGSVGGVNVYRAPGGERCAQYSTERGRSVSIGELLELAAIADLSGNAAPIPEWWISDWDLRDGDCPQSPIANTRSDCVRLTGNQMSERDYAMMPGAEDNRRAAPVDSVSASVGLVEARCLSLREARENCPALKRELQRGELRLAEIGFSDACFGLILPRRDLDPLVSDSELVSDDVLVLRFPVAFSVALVDTVIQKPSLISYTFPGLKRRGLETYFCWTVVPQPANQARKEIWVNYPAMHRFLPDFFPPLEELPDDYDGHQVTVLMIAGDSVAVGGFWADRRLTYCADLLAQEATMDMISRDFNPSGDAARSETRVEAPDVASEYGLFQEVGAGRRAVQPGIFWCF